jgi:hypothetical protein
MSMASPQVAIPIVTFEACSGFTHVTARRIAQPPTGDLCHEAPTHACGYPHKPLVSYRINRQLSGWIPPPLMIRAFGAHCHNPTLGGSLGYLVGAHEQCRRDRLTECAR